MIQWEGKKTRSEKQGLRTSLQISVYHDSMRTDLFVSSCSMNNDRPEILLQDNEAVKGFEAGEYILKRHAYNKYDTEDKT